MKRSGINKLFVLVFFVVGYAHADKPLWEAGAGVTYIDFASYRGSDQHQAYVLPIPYLVYRGDFLKVERERVRGMLFEGEKTELDVSVSGTVPVNSSETRARIGMPDLDPTFEIGPSLNVTLYESRSGNETWELRMPLRPAFAVDFPKLKGVGWLFQPNINLDKRNLPGMPGWNLGLLMGPIFADARYHQYFYGVEPQYATATRPAYEARGGYAGMQYIAALSKRFPTYWVGAFIKYDTLGGSVIADSPLVKSKTNLSAGFAISWIISASPIMVKDEDK